MASEGQPLGRDAADRHRASYRSAAQRDRRVFRGWSESGHDGDETAGGHGEPAWWLNLQARPDAEVRLAGGARLVQARAATGDERSRR
jgi:hypothetical protein